MSSGDHQIQVRQMVGTRLRQMRLRRNLTQGAAAQAIHGSIAKISRIENGGAPLRRHELHALLTLYGVTDPLQQDLLISIATGVRQPGWWFDDAVPLEDSVLWANEHAADLIRTYQPFAIPDLLRTDEYARAAHLARHYPAPESEVTAASVKNLLRRQQAFSARLWAIVDERVLLDPIGGDVAVHLRQLDALAAASTARNVTIQVLPTTSPLSPMSEPFTIFRLPGKPRTVVLHRHAGDEIGNLSANERYGLLFDQLAGTAKQRADTPRILSSIRETLSGGTA